MSNNLTQTSFFGWSRLHNQNLSGESRTKIQLNRSFHLHVVAKVVFDSLEMQKCT